MTLALPVFLMLSLAAPVTLVTTAREEESPTLTAMRDELARTLERLRMDAVSPPYFVTYTLSEQETYSCSAQFGALVSDDRGGGRSISSDLRVGDLELDNTNFVNRYYLTGRRRSVSLTHDDDYWTTRQRLWLASDTQYKSAVEDLAAKVAWLQTNQVPDRPAEMTLVEPIEHHEPLFTLDLDRDAVKGLTKRLSAIFRDSSKVQGSRLSFTAGVSSSTAISSEGRDTRTTGRYARLIAQAWTQADDGMPLGDLEVWYARTTDELPDAAALEAEVRRMSERLTERVDAERAEEYIGPVLFEGEAACFLMLELLIDRLSSPHEPLGMPTAGTPFKNRLNRRVTPNFLTVIDDPTRTEFEGTPLLGHFTVDDDGVPAQPLTLVDQGRLRAWYMSRIPTRAIVLSNGHSVGGDGGPGNVFVRSEHTLSKDALRAELLAVAKDQELPYGIRVEVMARSDVSVSGVRASGRYRDGAISLSPPVAAYRVYLDGREEPIRGGEWQGVTLRSLRDIYVTGDTPTVLNAARGGFVSVVCPDLLIEELEMKKPEEQESKLPYLPHPAFEGR